MTDSAAIVVLVVVLLALSRPAAAAREGSAPVRFYVSTGGDDGWSGRLPAPNADRTDGPFARISRARDAIRALGAAAREAGPIAVCIRAGRYSLSEPIVFQPQDSGRPGAPITYEAYEGEVPVISGGRATTGWVRDGEVWRAQVLGVAEGEWHFRQLFVNGRRAQRARSPNDGFFHVKGALSMGEQATFAFQGDDIKAEWARRGDVEVIALQAWAEVRMPITAVDEAAKLVTLAGKCAPSNREDDTRYWVENAPELLDAPGEWYLDRSTGEVTYWPRPGENMATAEVIAPFLTELVRIEGDASGGEVVSDLHFRGLTFAYTDWTLGATGYTDMQAAYDIPAVFAADGATSVSLTECRFQHLGGYAISFGTGCRGNQVRGCEISDVGAGGIKIGEPAIRKSELERTGGNHIVGNHIHDIGAVYPAAVGVWVGQSAGNAITGNHIHDTWYTGISVGWTWGYGETNARDNLIESNHVHHIGRGLLSDMGAIYTLGMQPGTVIRGNLFHDITSYGYGGWGIYLDEGSTSILVEGNIVYNTKSGGFHQHYGRENVIRNNIFAFSREAQIVRTRMEDHRSFVFERNIVYWREGPLLGGNWADGHFLLDFNLYWNAAGSPFDFAGQSPAEWQERGQDVHSVIADPLFADAEHYDFRLRRGSPARALGIKPIRVQAPGR
jgi:parallel beta-helix repeat protein